MPIINISSNCKYCILDNISYELMYDTTTERKVAKLKSIFSKARILVQITTTDKKIRDLILDNFEVYSCNDIPVGYGPSEGRSNYQHHIVVKNTYSNASNTKYLRPAETKIKVLETDKDKIIDTLTQILKSKRRKTDVVDLLLEQLETK